MRNIIIMGPPGSGKDTQIEELRACFDFVVISGGDVARSLAKKNKKLAEIINHGDLIKDDLVLDEIDDILVGIDESKGVVFDGFPRDMYQAEKLNQILIAHHRTLDGVIYIAVSEEEVVRRLSSRRICALCSVNIPLGAEKCSKCGGRPIRRPDDEPVVIINRMQTFLDKTMPLLTYYRNTGILKEVNGEQSIREVAEDIRERLDLCQTVKN